MEESDYYEESRRDQRKERRRLREKDRSKYKKTDRAKKEQQREEAIGESGLVTSVSGREISVHIKGENRTCTLRGSLKKERGDEKNLIVVGDHVTIGSHNQILGIKKRKTILSRTDNLSRKKRHIIAANVDQVYIVSSITSPSLKLSLIDRYIIAAQKESMTPLIVINKIDLGDHEHSAEEVATIYQKIGIPIFFVSAVTKEGMDKLTQSMDSHISVFSGQSGVGKTSLLNIVTGLSDKTGEIVEKTQKGSHTTTRAKLIQISEDGYCIDTPGIRSFALWNVTHEDILRYFSDLNEIGGGCKYPGCSHTHEPDCGVKAALEEGKISKLRFESYLSIWREYDENQEDPRA